MAKFSSKGQKLEADVIRLESIVVQQGDQLSMCWGFLKRLMLDEDMTPELGDVISKFLTNQPFYDMEGRHGVPATRKATTTTGD